MTAPLAVKIFTGVTMLIVAIWLRRRPEPVRDIIHPEHMATKKVELETIKTEKEKS